MASPHRRRAALALAASLLGAACAVDEGGRRGRSYGDDTPEAPPPSPPFRVATPTVTDGSVEPVGDGGRDGGGRDDGGRDGAVVDAGDVEGGPGDGGTLADGDVNDAGGGDAT